MRFRSFLPPCAALLGLIVSILGAGAPVTVNVSVLDTPPGVIDRKLARSGCGTLVAPASRLRIIDESTPEAVLTGRSAPLSPKSESKTPLAGVEDSFVMKTSKDHPSPAARGPAPLPHGTHALK
jgi:hypothetical protein